MLAWLMSLILLLFGVSVPVTGGPDQPMLDCSKPLSGTIGSGWGLSPPHSISSYTTTLADGQVTLTVRSSEGDEASLSKAAPAQLVARLCEAINQVPGSEWNSQVLVTDIGPLMVDMSDGTSRVKGQAFTVDVNPRMGDVSAAERELTGDLYAKLKKEAESWG